MAIKGHYNDIMKGVVEPDKEMEQLRNHEVASLFIPAQNTQNCIMKITHLMGREFYLNQVDAPREFVLKVVETVCGGGIYHAEGPVPKFSI
jgi:hypothetical protein